MASAGVLMPSRPRPAPHKTRGKNDDASRLQFIHIASPSETKSGQRLSLIRSHAAKQVHASRRNALGYSREISGGSSSHSDEDPTLQDSTTATTTEIEDTSAASENWTVSRPRQGKRSRALSRKKPQTSRENSLVPSPIQIIGGSVKDAGRTGFAWTLSEDEYRLFEYYTQWVLKHGFEDCVPVGMEAYFSKAHTISLLPFTMARPGLLSGMMYIAARRLSLNTTDASQAQELTLKTLRYRLQCLGFMKEAVSQEAVPTDETITLGMMMCSEAYRERDKEAMRAHAQAVYQMVTTRGGLKAITAMSGFLEFLLATSIWDPRYKMLGGPSADKR